MSYWDDNGILYSEMAKSMNHFYGVTCLYLQVVFRAITEGAKWNVEVGLVLPQINPRYTM